MNMKEKCDGRKYNISEVLQVKLGWFIFLTPIRAFFTIIHVTTLEVILSDFFYLNDMDVFYMLYRINKLNINIY